MFSIINQFLIWWLRSGRYGWSRLRRKLFEGGYLSQELPVASSLDDIQACLAQVKWTMDGPLHLFDSISYPQTVWFRKKDDCDGFAVLAAALLQRWQPDCSPVLLTAMLRPVKKSHTICCFNSSSDLIWYFDNGKLRQSDYKTYAEIVAAIWGQARLVCWDVVTPDTLQPIEFHRT